MTDPAAPDPHALLAAAATTFRDVLVQLRPEQLGDPTPCPDWTVQGLVDHVSYGNLWASLVQRGSAPQPAMEQARSTASGGDLVADFDARTAEQAAAFAEPGGLERTVHHFLGHLPARRFVAMRTGEMIVHSWDLARALGVDERLPEPMVQLGLAVFGARGGDALAATGMFGAGAQGAPPSDDPQTRLLHLTGRRP